MKVWYLSKDKHIDQRDILRVHKLIFILWSINDANLYLSIYLYKDLCMNIHSIIIRNSPKRKQLEYPLIGMSIE